jgi:hypothetical protein
MPASTRTREIAAAWVNPVSARRTSVSVVGTGTSAVANTFPSIA